MKMDPRLLPAGMTTTDGCRLKNCEDDRRRIFLYRGHSLLPFHRTVSDRGNPVFLQFMSLGNFSFGCLVRMQVERSSSASISYLPFCILCSMGSSITPTDLVTRTTFIPFFFPEWVMAHSALSLEPLAMMKPNRVQNA